MKNQIIVSRSATGYSTPERARKAARFLTQAEIEAQGYTPMGPPQVQVTGFKKGEGWSAVAKQHGVEDR